MWVSRALWAGRALRGLLLTRARKGRPGLKECMARLACQARPARSVVRVDQGLLLYESMFASPHAKSAQTFSWGMFRDEHLLRCNALVAIQRKIFFGHALNHTYY
mmetsp:Transcript_38280/g.61707  ORF Transcript_38280/g.61707 Transcript_38280/m.61707 type:complete len:105 (-) Transcript_38280:2185-2499(-)